jgi:hypothetical protein
MNSRDTIPPSGPHGDWRTGEPPEPPPHSAGLAAGMRTWLNETAPLAHARAWLNETALLARMQSWIDERSSLTGMWASLARVDPFTFARYLIVFFIGVVATVVWQPGGTKDASIEVAPAALASLRQSIDRLAAEVTRIRAVEQDILDRISAPPPQPGAAPGRSPAQRPAPGR